MRPTTGPRSRAGVGAPRCRGVRADVAVGPLVPGIHLELEAVGRSPHQDSLPVLHLAAQDQPGETVADLLLHQALEGTRPVQRVEALRGEPAGRGLVHVQADAPLAQAVGDRLDLECDDAAELLAGERLAHDDVVETVEELGLKEARTTCITRSCFSFSASVWSCSATAPRFEVRMRIVERKSTVRPWPSVRRPSSSTCSSTSNTSWCAFSISSSSTTE